MNFFLQTLADDPVFFVSWFVTVVVSISLHELAHGAAAIWRGDDTPRVSGHMTVNPMVHMGLWSMIALLVAGIAWGQMPIDTARLRGRWSGAIVAVAGPLTNFLLAAVGLTALAGWQRWGAAPQTVFLENVQQFAWIFGCANLVLGLFNLVPVPPLDGSHVVADFSRSYASFISDPAHQGTMFMAFVFAFAALGPFIFDAGQSWASSYVQWVVTL
jgi:Zn-dependent protease